MVIFYEQMQEASRPSASGGGKDAEELPLADLRLQISRLVPRASAYLHCGAYILLEGVKGSSSSIIISSGGSSSSSSGSGSSSGSSSSCTSIK